MKTLINRFGILLLALALTAGSVFAQEEATPNSFTSVLLILLVGMGAVVMLGAGTYFSNKNNSDKNE